MSLTKEQRKIQQHRAHVLQAVLDEPPVGRIWPSELSPLTAVEQTELAVADYLAALEGLLREIGAYCEPIAPGLDPVGLALYERIGPLLAGE